MVKRTIHYRLIHDVSGIELRHEQLSVSINACVIRSDAIAGVLGEVMPTFHQTAGL